MTAPVKQMFNGDNRYGRWVLTKIVTPMGSWDNININAAGAAVKSEGRK